MGTSTPGHPDIKTLEDSMFNYKTIEQSQKSKQINKQTTKDKNCMNKDLKADVIIDKNEITK